MSARSHQHDASRQPPPHRNLYAQKLAPANSSPLVISSESTPHTEYDKLAIAPSNNPVRGASIANPTRSRPYPRPRAVRPRAPCLHRSDAEIPRVVGGSGRAFALRCPVALDAGLVDAVLAVRR
ncbi:protein of unknown function [Burkholderia multivorans]